MTVIVGCLFYSAELMLAGFCVCVLKPLTLKMPACTGDPGSILTGASSQASRWRLDTQGDQLEGDCLQSTFSSRPGAERKAVQMPRDPKERRGLQWPGEPHRAGMGRKHWICKSRDRMWRGGGKRKPQCPATE